MKQKSAYYYGIFLLGGIGIGILGALSLSQKSKVFLQNIPTYTQFDTILTILKTDYYDKEKIQTGKMEQNALKGYVDALDDPYTTYMDPEINSWFQEEIKGETDFEWIGAVISKKSDYILIEEILKESPAAKAGLLPLDKILAINTGSTKTLTVNDAIKQIRGPKGTNVLLTIERTNKQGIKNLFQQSVIRDKLSVPSVTNKIINPTSKNPIALISISIIGEETNNLLIKTIGDLSGKNIQGIILDLRGNGGWLLNIAGEICSHFIPRSKLIVSAKYRHGEDQAIYSEGYGELEGIPVVVLVDQMTASAGEIIALALQEQIGAKIIGTQTFGKWSIQGLESFNDGWSLKYTIGKRYSPSGKSIDHTGIVPDIAIAFDPNLWATKAIDSQLEKAKQILLHK